MPVPPRGGIGFQLVRSVTVQLLQGNDVRILVLHSLEVSRLALRDFGEAIPDVVRDDAQPILCQREASGKKACQYEVENFGQHKGRSLTDTAVSASFERRQ